MNKLVVILCSIVALVGLSGCANQTCPGNCPNKNMNANGANTESHQVLTDTAITTDVKAAFMGEKLFGNKDISAMSIHVETTNGVVYLTGTADSTRQIKNAIRIAKGVNGVKRVVSTVKVQH